MVNTDLLNSMLNNFGDDVYKAIDFAEKTLGEYPITPLKPLLHKKHPLGELKIYTDNFEKYNVLNEKHKDDLADFKIKEENISDTIIEYIKIKSDLFDLVPVKYVDSVYSLAYQQGHSGGYYEVYQKLVELVDIFK